MLQPVRDTIKGKLLMKYDSDKRMIQIAKSKCISTIIINDDGSLYIESEVEFEKEE